MSDHQDIEKLLEELAIANKEAAIAKNEAAIAKKEAAEDKKELAGFRIGRYLTDSYAFPVLKPLGTHGGSTINYNHDPILNASKQPFQVLEIPSGIDFSKYCALKREEVIQYTAESDVQAEVKNLLIDMLALAGIRDVNIVAENSIESMKADLWLILRNGIPIGAIEVKRPDITGDGYGVFNHPQAQGQIFDYMLKLRSYHGIQKVFGVLTTFDKWLIVWLPDSDDLAMSSNLTAYTSSIPVDPEISSKRDIIISTVIYTTESPKELCQAIVSVLLKMRKAGEHRNVVSLTSAQSTYITIDKSTWKWTSFKTALKFTLSSPMTSSSFILLRDYHGGADGRVWLSAASKPNPDGAHSIVVLKFIEEETLANNEAAAWKQCGFDSYVCKLFDRFCVVMPYALHAKITDNGPSFISSLNEWSCIDGLGAETNALDVNIYQALLEESKRAVPIESRLRDAVEFLSKAKVAHLDIEWRHVAILPIVNSDGKLEKFQNILLDLTRCENTTTEEDARSLMSGRVSTLCS